MPSPESPANRMVTESISMTFPFFMAPFACGPEAGEVSTPTVELEDITNLEKRQHRTQNGWSVAGGVWRVNTMRYLSFPSTLHPPLSTDNQAQNGWSAAGGVWRVNTMRYLSFPSTLHPPLSTDNQAPSRSWEATA